MEKPHIITHQVGKSYQEPHYFVLSKGNNAGKPLESACPNCFVLVFQSEQLKQYWYWLNRAVFHARAFQIELRGSVIPFITTGAFKRILFEFAHNMEAPETFLTDYPNQFNKLQALERTYKQNLALIADARSLLFKKFIRR